MLLLPLVVGAVIGANGGGYAALLYFAIAAISLFWLRTPTEALLGTSVIKVRTAQEKRHALVAVAITGTICSISLAELFAGIQHLGLLAIGSVAGLAFALQALLKRDRKFRALAQIVGAIGLSSTAASAYYLVAGKLDLTAVAVWVISWLFAAEQIEFVQLRIRASRLESFRARLERARTYLFTLGAIVGTVILLTSTGMIPSATIVAFLPATLRAIVWFKSQQKALDVHRLGWSELVNAVTFTALLAVVFRTQ
jgi:hypothetical protein